MKSSLKNMVLSLTVLSVVLAVLLAGVYNLTARPIAEAQQKVLAEAMAAVLPPFDNEISADTVTIGGHRVYPAYEGGNFVGAAVETWSDNGFGGRIVLIAGFDADGSLHGYRVLSHAETPGLGAKMDTWFCAPEGHRSVLGTTSSLSVAADGGSVDAITGATITSRAFLEAINAARGVFESLTGAPGANSGDTNKIEEKI